jgi:sugar phosphate isomerase/epimerase
VLACIDAAARLGCPTVGTFVGRDPTRRVTDNLRQAEQVFAPLVDHAGERGVKLLIENCVMEGWHPDGYPGNLAYSPELWEWMFSLGLYLNFDPSHLVWMGIDPVTALRPYVDKIPHAQAKDIQLFPERRTRYGWPGKAVERPDPWDVGWWRYRVPGLGQVDWLRVVDTLYEGGFQGVLSVEHEDPVWGGTEDKVKTGLDIAHRTLRPLLVA